MPLIPEGVIDEIQARADIAELIGRYVPLKRAGRHFKANCPFHKEKTPSFMVNAEKQIFHCFGCGAGGNIFGFLMQHDRLTFPEAVRQLAEHVGIRVPDRQDDERSSEQAQLIALNEKICRYFERVLQHPTTGRPARAYLDKRGVPETARARFRLGLAPAGWSGLLTAAKSSGVTAQQLEAGGLIIRGKNGSYDRFRSRIMCPIQDVRGRVVGFGGRSLDGREPKYLNSPETAVYTKGRHLFGLAQAKDAIIASKRAVLVEGYFDCIGLVDAGIADTISPLGTALTSDQARLLKRYAEQVILAFDPDAAGEQATLRGIDLLVEAGLQVRIAQIPKGMDPDECVRAYGTERFSALLDQSVTIFECLLASAVKQHPPTRIESKVRAAQFVLPTIAKVPDAMLRREYVRLLADRLRLDEGAVLEELGKAQPHAAPASPARPAGGPARSGGAAAQGAQRLLTALILEDPGRLDEVGADVLSEVDDPALQRILQTAGELHARRSGVTPAQIASRLSEEGHGGLVGALVELAESVSAKGDALDDCLRRLQAGRRARELAALREAIQAAQTSGREDEMQRLLGQYQERLATPKGG